MLLAKTLTSTTFKLALIAIGTFGVIVSAILGYVYLSTASYVRGRSDRAIQIEISSLQEVYERSGRDGLIDAIRRRMVYKGFADHVYILVDPSSRVLAGNLKAWPQAAAEPSGWPPAINYGLFRSRTCSSSTSSRRRYPSRGRRRS